MKASVLEIQIEESRENFIKKKKLFLSYLFAFNDDPRIRRRLFSPPTPKAQARREGNHISFSFFSLLFTQLPFNRFPFEPFLLRRVFFYPKVSCLTTSFILHLYLPFFLFLNLNHVFPTGRKIELDFVFMFRAGILRQHTRNI